MYKGFASVSVGFGGDFERLIGTLSRSMIVPLTLLKPPICRRPTGSSKIVHRFSYTFPFAVVPKVITLLVACFCKLPEE